MSQSSVEFGKKRVFLVGTINFMTIAAEVATSKFVMITTFYFPNLVTFCMVHNTQFAKMISSAEIWPICCVRPEMF